MGYTTEFYGQFSVDPPLNEAEIEYLKKFAHTRRMASSFGPYYVDRGGVCGQDRTPDIINYNSPPEGQPGLWCQWVPSEDGDYIEWDGNEKFYDAAEWIDYIIQHFLKPDCLAKASGDPQFFEFIPHTVDGVVDAAGEDHDDRWQIRIVNNEVKVYEGRLVYDKKR